MWLTQWRTQLKHQLIQFSSIPCETSHHWYEPAQSGPGLTKLTVHTVLLRLTQRTTNEYNDSTAMYNTDWHPSIPTTTNKPENNNKRPLRPQLNQSNSITVVTECRWLWFSAYNWHATFGSLSKALLSQGVHIGRPAIGGLEEVCFQRL